MLGTCLLVATPRSTVKAKTSLTHRRVLKQRNRHGFWLWILIPFVLILVAAFVHDRRHKGTRIGVRSQQGTTEADSLGIALVQANASRIIGGGGTGGL
jgi:hypothetical protein